MFMEICRCLQFFEYSSLELKFFMLLEFHKIEFFEKIAFKFVEFFFLRTHKLEYHRKILKLFHRT